MCCQPREKNAPAKDSLWLIGPKSIPESLVPSAYGKLRTAARALPKGSSITSEDQPGQCHLDQLNRVTMDSLKVDQSGTKQPAPAVCRVSPGPH